MTFLDTHVVVWLYQRDRGQFSKLALQILDSCELRVSAAVALELEYLYEIKRLTERSGVILSYLQHSIGLRQDSCQFPQLVNQAMDMSWTRDPFDRLITANAALHNSLLLTKDTNIAKNYRHARW